MTVTAIQQHSGSPGAALDPTTMQALMAGGDCGRLSPEQKNAYYVARCDAAGLDYRAQPFAFMRLNGKEVLYALKAATDQLAAKHGVRMTIVSQATEDGIRVVTVRAEAKDGRVTEEIGALPIKGLTGEAMSNALMKCVTKAKRRAVLSLCGLGLLDETEVESIPNAAPVVETAPVVVVDPPKPAPPAQVKPPPAYVAALWKRCHDAHGSEAREKLHTAAIAAMGENYPPSREWTKAQADSVESVLFPGDISY